MTTKKLISDVSSSSCTVNNPQCGLYRPGPQENCLLFAPGNVNREMEFRLPTFDILKAIYMEVTGFFTADIYCLKYCGKTDRIPCKTDTPSFPSQPHVPTSNWLSLQGGLN